MITSLVIYHQRGTGDKMHSFLHAYLLPNITWHLVVLQWRWVGSLCLFKLRIDGLEHDHHLQLLIP